MIKKVFPAAVIAAACIVFVLAPSSFAQCPGKNLEVKIEGNKKTKASTIRRLAKIRGECVPEEGLDAADIKQKLLNAHLFSEVEVNIEEGVETEVVNIRVKEKWTIIPVPVFYTSGEKSGGGLMVLESNLLGRKKMLVVGGSYSNVGNKYEAIYIDDAFFGTDGIFVVRPLFIERDIFQYDDEEEIYGYHEKYSLFFTIFGWKITDHIAPGLGLIYRYRDMSEAEDYVAPPEQHHSNGAMFNLRVTNTDYTDYYDKGHLGTVVLEHAIEEFGADTIYGRFKVTWDFTYPVWKVLSRTFVEAGISFGEDVSISNYFRLGGSKGRRGVPDRGVWVDDYLSLSQAFEQELYEHKLGTLTITEFGDLLFTEREGGLSADPRPFRTYGALGLGLRVYLKDIAIPAVGVDGAYGFRNEGFHVTAYIGQAF